MANPNPVNKFKSGNKGKPKGAVNKLTKTVKETVLAVFNDLQDDPKHNLMEFAKKNPRDFYQIAAKLLPMEVEAKVQATVTGFNYIVPEDAP